MTTGEIALTVTLTVIAGATVAIFTNYLGEWRTKRKFFKALYDEIGLNIKIAADNSKALGNPDLHYLLSPFYTTSYQNIRTSGELFTLPGNHRIKLETTYNRIYSVNKTIEGMASYGLPKNLDKIINIIGNNLFPLMDYLHKDLKFLKRRI